MMIIVKILIIILLLILILIGLLTIGKNIYYYFYNKKENKRLMEKRFCHHCEKTYLSFIHDNYKYCPICGRELTFINGHEEESND